MEIDFETREHIARSFATKNDGSIPYDHKNSWKTFLKFLGPGYLIAVGYMDPGNWETDIKGGSQFGYSLLFVILFSNIIAILFQSLCIRLGVVTGTDLAQQCRKFFPRWLNMILYILAEISIISTDLAEVIGSAIALKLLFGLPLIWGVLVTAFDVMLVLKWWGDKYQKYYEFGVFVLVAAVMICFSIQLGYTKPDFIDILKGYVPVTDLLTNHEMLYIAISIIGATVMPHNLYLHSSVCKNRRIFIEQKVDIDAKDDLQTIDSDELALLSGNDKQIEDAVGITIKFAVLDTLIALTFAFIINSTILIVGASAPLEIDEQDILEATFNILNSYVGKVAGACFAVALLLSGQSSSVTGTMAGEIIMSGFLDIKISPALRRIITRLAAIIPAVITILIFGNQLDALLVLSQVVLSAQLPFAVFPLIIFTSSKKLMRYSSGKHFATSWYITTLAYICAALITFLNLYLVLIEILKLF